MELVRKRNKAKHRLRDNEGMRSHGRSLPISLTQDMIFCAETVSKRCISSYKGLSALLTVLEIAQPPSEAPSSA